MSELENELKELITLVTEKQDFIDDIKQLSRYQENFKRVKQNIDKLVEVHIGLEAEKKTVLSYWDRGKMMGYPNATPEPQNDVAFYFSNKEVINWFVSVLSLILDLRASILKEQLSDIKKGAK